MSHIRIETREIPRKPHIVSYDRVVVVGDGTEIDISSIVTGWRLTSDVGAARKAELDLLSFEIVFGANNEIPNRVEP